MTFDEGGLAGTTVADQDALEGGHIGLLCHFDRLIIDDKSRIRIWKGKHVSRLHVGDAACDEEQSDEE
jgi:hypothetical protein